MSPNGSFNEVFQPKPKSIFLEIVISLVSFFASLVLLNYQTGGDQIGYRALYSELENTRITEIIQTAYLYIGGGEPVSIFVLWVGAVLKIDKDIYVSILNAILILSLFRFAKRNRVHKLTLALLIVNFYLIVLMVSAERLKISYIFLLFGALSKGTRRNIYLLLSFFAHFQTGILLCSLLIGKGFDYFYITRKKISITQGILLFFLLFPIFFFIRFFFDAIFYKFSIYQDKFSFSEFYNIIILILFSIILVKHKFKFLVMMMPILWALYFFGGTRINMIAVSFVFYYLIVTNKLSSFYMYPLMIYFVLKSFWFINLIVKYGDGFDY